MRRLQRRLSAQRLLWLISRPIRDNNCVFHRGSVFCLLLSAFHSCTGILTLIGRVLGVRSIASTAACTLPSTAVCVMITSGTKPSSV